MAFSIATIIVFGLCADYLFKKVKMPGLVGAFIAGILCGPYDLNLISPDMMTVSGDFKKIAFIVILLRVGFELRRGTLNRIGRAAPHFRWMTSL
jgi:NhaP-type Na+/H+ or K+/H+ antiporter